MQKSGIYKILNKINGKFYIGSAVNIHLRWRAHKSQLECNRHTNIYLQNAWNKYWSISFEFSVVEYCDKEKLLEREQWWLDSVKSYDRNIGYNILITAGSPLGTKLSEKTKLLLSDVMIGFKHSEESKLKMSLWQIGRKMSDEAKERMSRASKRLDFWPHKDGNKCKCEECNVKKRNYLRNRRIIIEKAEFQVYASAYICGQM